MGVRPIERSAVHSDDCAWVEAELKDVGDQASLFGGLRASTFELSALLASDVFRGVLLLYGIGSLALPPWDSPE